MGSILGHFTSKNQIVKQIMTIELIFCHENGFCRLRKKTRVKYIAKRLKVGKSVYLD